MNGSTNTNLVLRVAVGSANPSKISAVRRALQTCLDRKGKKKSDDVIVEIEGFTVESAVDRQPIGDEDTCHGAKNRAQAAYAEYKKKHKQNPHISIGMEGGVEVLNTAASNNSPKKEKQGSMSEMYCMAWMAVLGKRNGLTVDALASEETSSYPVDKKPFFGLAKTASFQLPPKITRMILEDGMELGEADDKMFKRKNSKHGNGSVGLLTDNIIERAAYYEHAIVLALVAWIRPEVYPSNPGDQA